MHLESETWDGTVVVHVGDSRIDAAVAIQFKDRMRPLAAEASRRLVLDLSRVTFIDSSGLGAIVATRKALPSGAAIELEGLTPNVARVLRLTRMDSIFIIRELSQGLDPDADAAAPAIRHAG